MSKRFEPQLLPPVPKHSPAISAPRCSKKAGRCDCETGQNIQKDRLWLAKFDCPAFFEQRGAGVQALRFEADGGS